MNDPVNCLRNILHDSSLTQHLMLLLGSCFFFIVTFFAIRITRKIYRKATPGYKKENTESLSPLFYPCIIFIAVQFLIWNLRIDTHAGMNETAKMIFTGMIIFFILGFIFDVCKFKPYIKYITFPFMASAYSLLFDFQTTIIALSHITNHFVWLLWSSTIISTFVLIRHYTSIYSICGFLNTTGFFIIAICNHNRLASLLFSIWSGIFLGIGFIAKYREKKYKGLAICAVTSMGFMMASLSVSISYASKNTPLWAIATPVILIMPFFTNAIFSVYEIITKKNIKEKTALTFWQTMILICIYTINTFLGMSIRFTTNFLQAMIVFICSIIICLIAAYLYNRFHKIKNHNKDI